MGASEIKHIQLMEEKAHIEMWLRRTDWVPNKIITGEWETTDSRWTSYVEERKVKRARLDEVKRELGI